jgi:hypothetical protein
MAGNGFIGFTIAQGEELMNRAAILMLVSAIALMGATSAQAVVYFSEDFDSYDDYEAVPANPMTTNWNVTSVGTIELGGAVWHLERALADGGSNRRPVGYQGYPTNTQFVQSYSDNGVGSTALDTGAYNGLETKNIISTAAGPLWLHMDLALEFSNHGTEIFDVQVSGDYGNSWDVVWERHPPVRQHKGASTRPSTIDNADNYFGRVDIDLSNYAGSDILLRFRNYESENDEWFSMDNVLVDDQPGLTGSAVEIFSETEFTPGKGSLGAMITQSYLDPDGDPLTDDGGWSCGKDPWKHGSQLRGDWITQPDGPRARWRGPDPYPGSDGNLRHGMYRLQYPSDDANFAVCDYDAFEVEGGPSESGQYPQDEWLMTPILDLSRMSDVRLEWDDEGTPARHAASQGYVHAEVRHQILLMYDADDDGPDAEDEVIEVVFDHWGGEPEAYALRWTNNSQAYMEHCLQVQTEGGYDMRKSFFAWHFKAGNGRQYYAVDNIRVTGVPEPSTCVLLVCGALGLMLLHRRKK